MSEAASNIEPTDQQGSSVAVSDELEKRNEEQAHMLRLQREAIMRHRWIESQKAQRDVGSQAALEWIERHAESWRAWYEEQIAQGKI